MTSLTSKDARYTLIRGCSLMRNRRSGTGYFLGTVRRVVAVTSVHQRTALQELALGMDSTSHLSPEVADEIALFVQELESRGFLNRNQNVSISPQRFFDHISEHDIAARHLADRAEPELAQSEWVDGASDRGSSTVIARSLYPIVLSGKSRVITLLYSILLASGVSRVRFADRHHRPVIESTDVGFGAIEHSTLGSNYYDVTERARRDLSLFPIDSSARHDFDTSRPSLIVHYGDCEPEDLVLWSNQRMPHFVIHQPIGDEVVAGPLVIPGETPCVRCLSLYEIDNFGYTRLERISINSVNELPTATAHYVAAITAAQILHFIDRMSEPEDFSSSRNTGIGEVAYINFQRLTEPQVVAIARHPLCGCDR